MEEKVLNTDTDNGGVSDKTTQEAKKKPVYKVRTTIDPNTVIPVVNGFQGTLVVKVRKTGEVFKFEEYGDEQDMTFADLKSVRNSNKSFFANNWLMIDDPAVLDALNATQYYSKALTLKGFNDLFKKSPKEIKKIVSGLSKAQKRSVAYKARNLILENKLDSLRVIDALEEELGIKLLER